MSVFLRGEHAFRINETQMQCLWITDFFGVLLCRKKPLLVLLYIIQSYIPEYKVWKNEFNTYCLFWWHSFGYSFAMKSEKQFFNRFSQMSTEYKKKNTLWPKVWLRYTTIRNINYFIYWVKNIMKYRNERPTVISGSHKMRDRLCDWNKIDVIVRPELNKC